MRIRQPFAGAFACTVLAAGYLGLAPITIPYSQYHSDKVLHFVTFFLLTLSFYWTIETTRRRVLHLTLVICTLSLGVGSEVLQAVLPNGREFDYLDIVANVIGSLAALGLCAAYHRRMLERKRVSRGYRTVTGEEGLGTDAGEDVELGEGTGPQETGVTHREEPHPDLDAELDNWDENAEDEWDAQDVGNGHVGVGAQANLNGTGDVVEEKLPAEIKVKIKD